MFHDERVVYHSTGEEYSKRTESCSLGRALFVENEVQSEWLTNSRGEPRERTFISLLRKRNGLGHESRGNLCPGISVPDGNPAAALETSDLVGKIFAKKKKKTKETIHYSLVDEATARNYWPSFFSRFNPSEQLSQRVDRWKSIEREKSGTKAREWRQDGALLTVGNDSSDSFQLGDEVRKVPLFHRLDSFEIEENWLNTVNWRIATDEIFLTCDGRDWKRKIWLRKRMFSFSYGKTEWPMRSLVGLEGGGVTFGRRYWQLKMCLK